MSFKLMLVLLLSISTQAFAGVKKDLNRTPNQVISGELSIDKIKAVADASLKQYVVGQSDSITSISLDRQAENSENYVIKAIDKNGKCYQQSANVFVTAEQKIVVSVPKMPRASCQ